MKGEKFLSALLRKGFHPQQAWKEKARLMRARLDKLRLIFKSTKYKNPDDFFFTFEDLPPLGKEYWFLYFCVPGKKEQAIFTFGRADSPVVVNRSQVGAASNPQGKACAAVCWVHDGRKRVALDELALVQIKSDGTEKALFAASARASAVFRGSYPHFTASLERDGRTIFEAAISRKKSGRPYEIVELIRTPIATGIGAAMVNYYFEFSGTMGGKRVRGEAYLQKVVAAIPLAPWNWVRVHFAKSAVLDFFAAKPFGLQEAEVKLGCNEFFELNGKRLRLGELKLSSMLEGERRVWMLRGKNVLLVMESYAMQPFHMHQQTAFTYEEYFVVVKEAVVKAGGKIYTLSELGEGSGIVEDAYGYLI